MVDDVVLARHGQIDAFERLVRTYQEPLFRLALRTLGDRGAAEEVVQDTFVVIWSSLPSLEDPAAFSAWIYRVAVRRALNEARTRRRLGGDLVLDLEGVRGGSQLPAPPADSPEPALEGSEQRRALHTLLLELPAPLRVCWVLHELHDLSYLAIAAATGTRVSTVRGRIARARRRLAAAATADETLRPAA